MEPDDQEDRSDVENEERAIIYEAIQKAVSEHEPEKGVVTKFFCIIEVARMDDTHRPYLMYRTGDINGDGMTSWDSFGFLKSATTAVEEQHFGHGRDSDHT